MKKISIFLVLAGLIYFTGCTKKDEKTETTNKPQETTTPPSTTPVPTQTEKKEEPTKTVEEKKETIKNETNNKAAIKLNSSGVIDTTLTGSIDGFEKTVTYEFEARKDQNFFFRIIVAEPEKNPDANLYVPQLISPSGKIDGPFPVKTLKPHQLSESGIWKVVIGQNKSAGKPWKVQYNFILKIN